MLNCQTLAMSLVPAAAVQTRPKPAITLPSRSSAWIPDICALG